MDVQDKEEFASVFLFKFGHVIDDCIDFWENKVWVLSILPIEIPPSDTSSSVAENYPVWIEHRNNLK